MKKYPLYMYMYISENLAQDVKYEGVASQSNSFSRNRWPATKAIDGYLEEHLGADTCCITTALYYKTAWWKFFSNQSMNVAYLQIFLRKYTVDRHTGFSVFVFDDPQYIPPSSSGERVFIHDSTTCPNRVENITVNRLTKGIAIFNSKDPPLNTNCTEYEPLFATIEICEVRIIGCRAEAYGEVCKPCPSICPNTDCDAFNGSCRYQNLSSVVDNGSSQTPKTLMVIPLTASVFLIIVITITIAFGVRQKRNQKHKERNQEDTKTAGKLHFYDKIKKTQEENVYSKINLAVNVSVYEEITI
ncbi:uncharacterized protein LOC134265134 [Saccostrea cucullata]|uniref:uncharacterized protein LOC134265134 n=1 Tax=Saccostrea cuccullata TaxID=36930 RepID=UPI002ED60DDC